MNILVILERDPFADSNAANNRFIALAEGLIENGCNIDLLLLNAAKKLTFKQSGSNSGLNYKYIYPFNCPNFVIKQILNRVVPLKCIENKILRIIKDGNYDFIWFGVSSKIIQIGLRMFKYKLNIHYFHERSEYSWIGLSGTKGIHDKYLHKFIPQINILSVMTSKLKLYYEEYVGQKTEVIHLPMTVDFSRFKGSIEDNNLKKPYIAYCGTMNNKKDGVIILIQSFIKIMARFPQLHLYLAGPITPINDYLEQKSLIEKYNAENFVTYLGNLSKEAIPKFLSNASVLAMARPESKQAEGGFPTKLGEYLATGRPVCVTRVGEIENYLEHNRSAYFANPGSIDSFADALTNALTSKEADIIGAYGKNVAMKYFNKDIQAKVLFEFMLKNRYKA